MRRKAVFCWVVILNESQTPQPSQTFEFALTKRTRTLRGRSTWASGSNGHYGVEPNSVPTLSRRLAKFRDQKFSRAKGNTVVVTRPRELLKLLQRNLGEL